MILHTLSFSSRAHTWPACQDVTYSDISNLTEPGTTLTLEPQILLLGLASCSRLLLLLGWTLLQTGFPLLTTITTFLYHKTAQLPSISEKYIAAGEGGSLVSHTQALLGPFRNNHNRDITFLGRVKEAKFQSLMVCIRLEIFQHLQLYFNPDIGLLTNSYNYFICLF